MATQFDVIIVGGGPAGYVCAIRAAQLGLATAVIEKDKLGGVCVNIGCIPTKALLHSAYVAGLVAHDAKDLGIEVGSVKTDYGVAMRRSRKVSEQNSKGVEFLMKKHKVTVIKGTGVLARNRTVRVGKDEYQAKKAVVIATGSRVKGIPQIGLEINKTTVISSDEALFLETHPKTLADRGGRRGRLRVRRHLSRLRNQGHPDRGPAPDPAAGGRRIIRRPDQELQEARRSTVIAGAKVKKATVAKDKVTLEVETGGKTENDRGGEGADGGGPGGEHRGPGTPGSRRAADRSGIHQGEPGDTGDQRTRGLRHRRRGRSADAGPQGEPGGGRGRRADRRPPPPADQVRQRPQRHLLPPRGGQHRHDRGPGQGAEAGVPGRAVSRSAPTAGPGPPARPKGS